MAEPQLTPNTIAFATQRRKFCKDRTTPSDLLFQKKHIFDERTLLCTQSTHLFDYERNRRQRCPKLVRCSSGKPIQLREMLLARQNQFSGAQSVSESSGFLSDPEGVYSYEY